MASTTSRMTIRSLSRRGTLGLGLDVPRRIRPRMLSGTSNTRPLYAQPSQYVAGVTMEQLENDPSLREYFDANFGNWREAPETFTLPSKEKEEEAPGGADEDDAANATNPHGIILPPSLASRNIRPLVAYLRDPAREEGSRSCRRLRSDPLLPLIPGILHGSDPTASPPLYSHEASSKLLVKTPWFEIQREIDRHHYDHFTSRVYALTVFRAEDAHVGYHKSLQNAEKRSERQMSYHVDQDAMTVTSVRTPSALDVEIANLPEKRTPVLENVLVIPSDLQLHPVAHSAFCLNYRRYHPTKPIKLPLRPINEEESPAIKRGGFLLMVNKFVECLVEEGAVIPEFVGVECAGLRAKDVVRGERLVVPEGVRVSPRVGKVEGFLVGTVFGVRGKGGAGDD